MRIVQRCNKCAYQIFGANSEEAKKWAEMALRKALTGGKTPETIRDERYPSKKYLHPYRKPNYRFN